MPGLLDGLRVAVVGSALPLVAAASWFGELGADVRMRRTSTPDDDERLWLGDPPPLPDGATVDLLITTSGANTGGVQASVTVRYAGSGSTSADPHADLDGRALAARGGVAVAIGAADRAPLPVPAGCLEHMVGSHIAAAALAALLDGTTEVEVAGVDVVGWSVATNTNLYLPYGSRWFRAGRRANGSGGAYPYSIFDVADGQFCLIGRTPRDWTTLLRALGSPEWATQPRYQDLRAMGREYPDEVDEKLAPLLAELTRADLVALAAKHGFPGGPIRRPDEVLHEPAIGHVTKTADDGTSVRVPASPFEARPAAGRRDLPAFRDLLVLDLSWVWSGPAVGVALADLGATVVKVESATRPDNSRLRGRPEGVTVPTGAPELELAPYFHATNRGKRSVGLNLRTDAGKKMLAELAGRADVIIENLSPGVMDRLGIAAESVHERNPDCVYLSMRGYRRHPSASGLRAYAPVLSGGAGIEALVGYPGEQAIGMMTYGFSDANAASQGLVLALAGLYARRARGDGAAVRLSQLDAAAAANGLNLVRAQRGRAQPLRGLGRTEPVIGYEELPTAPWTSRDLLTTVHARWLGEVQVSRLPWRRDGELPAVQRPGPTLGAHTVAELTSRVGLSTTRVDELKAAGAVESPD